MAPGLGLGLGLGLSHRPPQSGGGGSPTEEDEEMGTLIDSGNETNVAEKVISLSGYEEYLLRLRDVEYTGGSQTSVFALMSVDGGGNYFIGQTDYQVIEVINGDESFIRDRIVIVDVTPTPQLTNFRVLSRADIEIRPGSASESPSLLSRGGSHDGIHPTVFDVFGCIYPNEADVSPGKLDTIKLSTYEGDAHLSFKWELYGRNALT